MNGELQQILHQSLIVLSVAGGPMLAALLAVGLLVGVLQAATQINDPAVGFVPRLAATLLVIWILGNWMMQRLAAYFVASVSGMSGR